MTCRCDVVVWGNPDLGHMVCGGFPYYDVLYVVYFLKKPILVPHVFSKIK